MSYFVRQKTIAAPDSGFKLVKVYAYADNEEPRLREPELTVLDVEGKRNASDLRCQELLDVIVESNFDVNDFALLFTFPEEIDDKAREKEVLSFLSRMEWVYRGKPAYVYCSERDNNGELRLTVLLRSDGKLTEDRLMSLCKRDMREQLSIRRIERDENGLLVLPSAGEAAQYCEWCCSDNIQRPVITVEDDAISIEDLEAFLKAKVGEDTTPIINRMFDGWTMTHTRLTHYEYGEGAYNPHIEFRLVKQGKSITKGKGSELERD